jgi:putative LysE/RhtB family amino acid efflux pump
MDSGLLFAKSVVAGFVVALPVGAIGAMCLRRAFHGRWISGLVTGAGAALADSVLAGAAVFGLSLITRHLLEKSALLRLGGGVFLIVLGIHMVRSRHARPAADLAGSETDGLSVREILADLATGFALTMINPATFLAFVGVFAGLGLFADQPATLLTEGLVLAGVFSGSMLWWATLTGGSAALRHHLPHGFIAGINGVLGIALVVFGVVSLAAFVQGIL